MRKEDEQAIRRTVALLRVKCQEHELCRNCELYISGEGCVLDRPPAYLNEDTIIECLS